jgi:hypothetical protein
MVGLFIALSDAMGTTPHQRKLTRIKVQGVNGCGISIR